MSSSADLNHDGALGVPDARAGFITDLRSLSYSILPGHGRCKVAIRHRPGSGTINVVTASGTVLARTASASPWYIRH